jgi:DNA-binding Xre family transcriptional regulator
MDMNVRVSLDRYLKTKNLTAYRLAQETAGAVARGSIFAMARGAKVKRVDLETLSEIMQALHRITGETVTPNDLFEVIEEADPDLEQALLDASAAELAAHLADLEKDIPPEELNAWHSKFHAQATPIVFDTKRRVWLEGDAAARYSDQKAGSK